MLIADYVSGAAAVAKTRMTKMCTRKTSIAAVGYYFDKIRRDFAAVSVDDLNYLLYY